MVSNLFSRFFVVIVEFLKEMENLRTMYDLKQFLKWIDTVQVIKNTVNLTIHNKFKIKFDWYTLNEDITVANLCYNQAVNLVCKNCFQV
jgi:hypothetical protein